MKARHLFYLVLVLFVIVALFMSVGTAFADKPDGKGKPDPRPGTDPGQHQGDGGKKDGKENDHRPDKVCDNGETDCPSDRPEPTKVKPKDDPEPTKVKPTDEPTRAKPTDEPTKVKPTGTPIRPSATTAPLVTGKNLPYQVYCQTGLVSELYNPDYSNFTPEGLLGICSPYGKH